MSTVRAIIDDVNAKAGRAGQGPALVYAESQQEIPGVDAVEFSCTITIPSGKEYRCCQKFMHPAGVFIELAKERLLSEVLYDLLNS
jgi:hypothetical protein